MVILGFIVGTILMLFIFAAALGAAIGLGIAIVKYIRNPSKLLSDLRERISTRTPDWYGY